MPGTLDPSDLPELCGQQGDIFAWAEEHLRALVDQPYPTLVPARDLQGHCHWYFDGRCAVHDRAPFSCAFFDSHQSDAEVVRRVATTIQACQDEVVSNGLYYRLWLHLRGKGLIGKRGDRSALRAEMRRIERQSERQRRRRRDSGSQP
jgi:hypothetical protein